IFYVTIISILTFEKLIHGLPQRSVTDLPNYTSYKSTLKQYDDIQPAASQQRGANYVENPYLYQNAIPIKQKVQVQQAGRPKNIPQQFRPSQEADKEKDPKQLEEEEEIEEPDRLSLLLPQSKFICTNKNTGYYADEDLGCEVFHYCQDNARHSWICPEGFTFHQVNYCIITYSRVNKNCFHKVHLICMPPGGDNICEKSSQFHFVNDYLYKPVNLEEYQQKPNVSLRYSERFYPENYYDENEDDRQPIQHKNSVRVTQEVPAIPKSLVVDPVNRATFRPETTLAHVFRAPNDVNVPLQQRRPQYLTQRFFTR
ncbi:cuticular protein analogous to peritrophins 1-G, partial [Asbolus verrucosus]